MRLTLRAKEDSCKRTTPIYDPKASAAGFWWWLSHPLLIGSDQALYASMAQLFLEGRVPYVDMFDNNPPLAFYLQIPPVVIAQLGNIPLPLSFSMYVSALTLLSSLLMLTMAAKS